MPLPRLYQIAHDARNPDGTVTTIRGMPESRRDAERGVRHLGPPWYVRHVAAPDPLQQEAGRTVEASRPRSEPE